MNQTYDPLRFDAFIELRSTLNDSLERAKAKNGVEIGPIRRFYGTDDAIEMQ